MHTLEKSLGGPPIYVHEQQEAAYEQDFLDSLVRFPGRADSFAGSEADKNAYIEGQAKVAELFRGEVELDTDRRSLLRGKGAIAVKALRRASRGGKYREFTDLLSEAHLQAVSSSYSGFENKAGALSQRPGVFDGSEGRPVNIRTPESVRVGKIAGAFQDSYAEFVGDAMKGDKTAVHITPVRGISRKNLPWSSHAEASGDVTHDKIEYVYPGKDERGEYLELMADLQDTIQQLKSGEAGIEEPHREQMILKLVAHQYQLGAIARPFERVNNSIMMSLANAHLESIGLKRIPHFELDHAAQRLSTETFEKLFERTVRNVQDGNVGELTWWRAKSAVQDKVAGSEPAPQDRPERRRAKQMIELDPNDAQIEFNVFSNSNDRVEGGWKLLHGVIKDGKVALIRNDGKERVEVKHVPYSELFGQNQDRRNYNGYGEHIANEQTDLLLRLRDMN